jgi:two-component system NarL family response regulator
MSNNEPGAPARDPRTRILLVSDTLLLCESLQALLRRESDLEVVGMTQVLGAVDQARALTPDLIITDTRLRAATGRQLLPELQRHNLRARLLVLADCSNREHLQRARAIPANGYLPMEASRAELVVAIRAIVSGLPRPCRQYSRLLPRRPRASRQAPLTSADVQITPRQREILAMIALGESSRKIALAMNRSIKTVETHRSTLMSRLGLKNAAELTRFAYQSGILSGTLAA